MVNDVNLPSALSGINWRYVSNVQEITLLMSEQAGSSRHPLSLLKDKLPPNTYLLTLFPRPPATTYRLYDVIKIQLRDECSTSDPDAASPKLASRDGARVNTSISGQYREQLLDLHSLLLDSYCGSSVAEPKVWMAIKLLKTRDCRYHLLDQFYHPQQVATNVKYTQLFVERPNAAPTSSLCPPPSGSQTNVSKKALSTAGIGKKFVDLDRVFITKVKNVKINSRVNLLGIVRALVKPPSFFDNRRSRRTLVAIVDQSCTPGEDILVSVFQNSCSDVLPRPVSESDVIILRNVDIKFFGNKRGSHTVRGKNGSETLVLESSAIEQTVEDDSWAEGKHPLALSCHDEIVALRKWWQQKQDDFIGLSPRYIEKVQMPAVVFPYPAYTPAPVVTLSECNTEGCFDLFCRVVETKLLSLSPMAYIRVEDGTELQVPADDVNFADLAQAMEETASQMPLELSMELSQQYTREDPSRRSMTVGVGPSLLSVIEFCKQGHFVLLRHVCVVKNPYKSSYSFSMYNDNFSAIILLDGQHPQVAPIQRRLDEAADPTDDEEDGPGSGDVQPQHPTGTRARRTPDAPPSGQDHGRPATRDGESDGNGSVEHGSDHISRSDVLNDHHIRTAETSERDEMDQVIDGDDGNAVKDFDVASGSAVPSSIVDVSTDPKEQQNVSDEPSIPYPDSPAQNNFSTVLPAPANDCLSGLSDSGDGNLCSDINDFPFMSDEFVDKERLEAEGRVTHQWTQEQQLDAFKAAAKCRKTDVALEAPHMLSHEVDPCLESSLPGDGICLGLLSLRTGVEDDEANPEEASVQLQESIPVVSETFDDEERLPLQGIESIQIVSPASSSSLDNCERNTLSRDTRTYSKEDPAETDDALTLSTPVAILADRTQPRFDAAPTANTHMPSYLVITVDMGSPLKDKESIQKAQGDVNPFPLQRPDGTPNKSDNEGPQTLSVLSCLGGTDAGSEKIATQSEGGPDDSTLPSCDLSLTSYQKMSKSIVKGNEAETVTMSDEEACLELLPTPNTERISHAETSINFGMDKQPADEDSSCIPVSAVPSFSDVSVGSSIAPKQNTAEAAHAPPVSPLSWSALLSAAAGLQPLAVGVTFHLPAIVVALEPSPGGCGERRCRESGFVCVHNLVSGVCGNCLAVYTGTLLRWLYTPAMLKRTEPQLACPACCPPGRLRGPAREESGTREQEGSAAGERDDRTNNVERKKEDLQDDKRLVASGGKLHHNIEIYQPPSAKKKHSNDRQPLSSMTSCSLHTSSPARPLYTTRRRTGSRVSSAKHCTTLQTSPDTFALPDVSPLSPGSPSTSCAWGGNRPVLNNSCIMTTAAATREHLLSPFLDLSAVLMAPPCDGPCAGASLTARVRLEAAHKLLGSKNYSFALCVNSASPPSRGTVASAEDENSSLVLRQDTSTNNYRDSSMGHSLDSAAGGSLDSAASGSLDSSAGGSQDSSDDSQESSADEPSLSSQTLTRPLSLCPSRKVTPLKRTHHGTLQSSDDQQCQTRALKRRKIAQAAFDEQDVELQLSFETETPSKTNRSPERGTSPKSGTFSEGSASKVEKTIPEERCCSTRTMQECGQQARPDEGGGTISPSMHRMRHRVHAACSSDRVHVLLVQVSENGRGSLPIGFALEVVDVIQNP